MNRILTFIFISINFTFSSYAQQWVATKTGNAIGDDAATTVATDNNGNVYVTGYLFINNHGADYVTTKYNSSGIQQWQRRYNGPGSGDDKPRAIFVDANANVYVTGISDAYPSYGLDNDVATVKYNSNGVQQWVARYDGNIIREDAGNAIKVDASGNVYVAGYVTVKNLGYSAPDYLTLKYNSAGVLQWSATHNGPGNGGDAAVGLGLDANGNVYVTGTDFAGSDPDGEGDIATIKYNSSGAEQWVARFNGAISEGDGATGIAVDPAGNSYITGSTRLGGIDVDYITLKYNTNGVEQWQATYGGDADQGDVAVAIALDNSGNVYVTGYDQKLPYYYDYVTLKYNASGQQQWTARYNGKVAGNDWATLLAVDASGNAYVTGQSIGPNFTWDIATVKYSTAGVKQWARTFDGPAHSDDIGNAVAVDANGNVYVAGTTTTSSDFDYITIKYNSAGQKEILETASDETAIHFQNYPNPFTTVTTIEYDLSQNRNVQFNIYDAHGNMVRNLNFGTMAQGHHSFTIDAKQLAAGTYFCEMKTEEEAYVKKLEITK